MTKKKTEVPIIARVARGLIKAELTTDKLLRTTNKAGNEIYIIDGNTAPNTLLEIGRLREEAFRDAGGGTGEDKDLDKFDFGYDEKGHKVGLFKQLIVWNPQDKEIVGGYRYIQMKDLATDEKGHIVSPTAELFRLSRKFEKEYAPNVIELGRSFVSVFYQATSKENAQKGLFSMDNLWDGLGALVVDYPEIQYFFGKFTMYPKRYNSKARDLILSFLKTFLPDPDKLIRPKRKWTLHGLRKRIARLRRRYFIHTDVAQNKKILVDLVKSLGEFIPPLVNSYMNLSETMRFFGTVLHIHFGDVEESGILIAIGDIRKEKKDRHIQSYIGYRNDLKK